MRTYIQPGDSLAVAVPYAGGVTSGQGVLVGALFGIAAVDGAQNALIEIATKGVFDIAKEPSLAITEPPRVCRRPHGLRGWGHDEEDIEPVFA
jgi:predicted RecA/RadA family phage recombinase